MYEKIEIKAIYTISRISQYNAYFFHREEAVYYTAKLVEKKATEVNSGHVSSC